MGADTRSAGEVRHLVLVGLTGVGKSTVGRLVAERLHMPFADNDDLLVEATGQSAEDIASAQGLDALHRTEVELLARALERAGALVLPAAASVVTSEVGRAALSKATHVVWLRDDPAAVTARIERSGQYHRPDFGAAGLRRVDAERRTLFESVATAIVDVAGDPPELVADRTIQAIAIGAR